LLREQLRNRLEHVASRVIHRLMRWADPEYANSEPAPAPSTPEMATEPTSTSPEEREVEAALDAALDLSQSLAKEPPTPPRTVEIYTDATPNPNAMKFTASVVIVESGSLSIASKADAEKNPMAKRLFALEGIESLFAVNDFCTVIKATESRWSDLIGPIEHILLDELSRP
jgi:hypothetical protein